MPVKKVIIIALLSLAIIFLGVKAYSFWTQEKNLNAQLSDIGQRLTKAQSDEVNFQNDVQYLANPVNLEKELRSRFNYKAPGETMIIMVPTQSSTVTSTSD